MSTYTMNLKAELIQAYHEENFKLWAGLAFDRLKASREIRATLAILAKNPFPALSPQSQNESDRILKKALGMHLSFLHSETCKAMEKAL